MTVDASALSERVETCLAALDDAGRAIARRAVLRLIRFGEAGAEGHDRQPASVLRGGDDPERFAEVLRRLTEAELVTVDGADGDAVVDLAHGELIANSPTLQAWVSSHGQTEQLRRRLETDAAEWQRAEPGRDAGLLDRVQLGELAGWLTAETERDLGVSERATSYIAASRAAARRGRWPGRSVLGSALAIVLMLMLLATPIVLLFVVVLTAFVIHRFGLFG